MEFEKGEMHRQSLCILVIATCQGKEKSDLVSCDRKHHLCLIESLSRLRKLKFETFFISKFLYRISYYMQILIEKAWFWGKFVYK